MSDFEQAARTEEIWGGDWKRRIERSIKSLGFNNIQEFLDAYPADPYSKLVKRLGNSFAPLQICQLQFANAVSSGKIRDAAIDSLTREINGKLKRGWGYKVNRDFNRAHAFACWSSDIEQHAPEVSEFCKAVWSELEKIEPPVDWKPQSPNDEYLVRAFSQGWPK